MHYVLNRLNDYLFKEIFGRNSAFFRELSNEI